MDDVGISVSRSCVPFDIEPAWVTSGLRIGTPAITTRGMKEEEMRTIVQLMDDAMMNREDKQKVTQIQKAVQELCVQFSIYS